MAVALPASHYRASSGLATHVPLPLVGTSQLHSSPKISSRPRVTADSLRAKAELITSSIVVATTIVYWPDIGHAMRSKSSSSQWALVSQTLS